MQKRKFPARAMMGAVAFAMVLGSANVHAQSSVTLYGIIDSGILYQSKSMNPTTGANEGSLLSFGDAGLSASAFGIHGVESLGDGLKAEFDLEGGFNSGTGGYNDSNGNLFGRESWIALDSDRLGMLKAGVQLSPFFLTLYDLDPRKSFTGSSLLPYLYNVSITGAFVSNAVSYTSPAFHGLSGSVMYAFGNVPGDIQAGRQVSARLKYQYRNLLLEAAWYNANPGAAIITNPPDDVPFEGRMIGASYRFNKATVSASFTNYKVEANSITSTGNDNNVYQLAASWDVTPSVNLSGAAYYQVNRNDTGSHSLSGTLGVEYYLSKRTTLYTQMGVVHNQGNMTQGLVTGENQLFTNTVFLPDGTSVVADFGIRHTF